MVSSEVAGHDFEIDLIGPADIFPEGLGWVVVGIDKQMAFVDAEGA